MTWLLPPLPPNFAAALRDVHAKHVDARMAAAKRLAQPTAAERAQALSAELVLVSDQDARVRAAAIEALGELGEASALPALVESLQDVDPAVRELSVIAISHHHGDAAHAQLMAATRSSHPEVRFQAILCVAELCGDRAEPQIRRLLSDDDARVRASAVRAAAALPGEHRSPNLLAALASALDDDDRLVRGEAAVLLGSLGDARAVPALALAIDEPELWLGALDAAATLRDERLVAPVARLARSFLASRAAKAAAARALVCMDDPRGVPALREVLTGLRGDGRAYAVEVAGELGLDVLLPELLGLLRRPRGVDRLVLAKSLAKLGAQNPQARPAVATLAQGDDEAAALCRAEIARWGSVEIAEPGPEPP